MQLTVTDIDADHLRGTGLQQAVGEAAGGLADVEADPAGDSQTGVRQGAGQLEAAARNVAVAFVFDNAEDGVGRQFQRRLGDRLAVDEDPAFADQPLRLRA